VSFPKDLCARHLARSGAREPTPETWTCAGPDVLQSLRSVLSLMGSVLIRRRPSSTTTLPLFRGSSIRSSCSRRRSTCALGRRPDPRRKITTEDVTAYLSANLLGWPARRPPRRSRLRTAISHVWGFVAGLPWLLNDDRRERIVYQEPQRENETSGERNLPLAHHFRSVTQRLADVLGLGVG
jgi:hypothetical protein